MYKGSIAEAMAADLEPDVIVGLAKRSKCGKCSRFECQQQETETIKFRQCSKCLIAKYCSTECQKVDWQSHKIMCKKSHAVAAEQSGADYKAAQKRLTAREKTRQKKLASNFASDNITTKHK
uniref:MYND-type domain-containing protein n=1 Tax=Octactis speculum TaxID=3111310 RepID=A0A7S2GWX1_9STRA|mmetsp:Transcript_5882/g.7268  ORF Transcript_5882/g.7268 Transcript_5882/m.7268 type:complete len:122 (+) Transcript_5882:3-368(+)